MSKPLNNIPKPLNESGSKSESEPDFFTMPIEQVNQYLIDHGYDPEAVGLRGEILAGALLENLALRERAEKAEATLKMISNQNVMFIREDQGQNAWCFTLPDFKNLQESPAFFIGRNNEELGKLIDFIIKKLRIPSR
jgi:hypothetical protein